MSRPSKTVVVDQSYGQLSYDELDAIVRDCGGWLREGGPSGDAATVWHGDVEYVFREAGLISFLYAVKSELMAQCYEALDLCDYIAQSADQPPTVFVRDAIVHRAAVLKARIRNEAADRG